MSYDPPPLEPELAQFEAELRGLRPIAPDPDLVRRVLNSMEAPVFEVIAGAGGEPVRIRRSWRRIGSAGAAAAAVVAALAMPSFRPDGSPRMADQPATGGSPIVGRGNGRIELSAPGTALSRPQAVWSPRTMAVSAQSSSAQNWIGPEPAWLPLTERPSGFLGVRPECVDPSVRAQLGIDGGALITGILLDAPAQVAGLRLHDIIVSVDGEPVTGKESLKRLISTRPAGSQVRLGIIRGGVRSEKTVQLAAGEPSA